MRNLHFTFDYSTCGLLRIYEFYIPARIWGEGITPNAFPPLPPTPPTPSDPLGPLGPDGPVSNNRKCSGICMGVLC